MIMNELKVFEQRELLGKDFRIYGTKEEPLFLAKDVANWIGHSDTSKMVKNIDESEKLIGKMFVSGQNRDVLMLTEDGLYEVLMLSQMPIAKEFKKEVKRILKEIRLTGGHISNSDLMIETYYGSLDVEQKAMVKCLLVNIENKQKENRELQLEVAQSKQIIAEYEPKVTYHDLFLQSTNAVPITLIAKDYGLSAKKLNKLLHELKIQFKQSDIWLLYNEHAKMGYTKSHTYEVNGRSYMSTNWTQKGRLFIYDELKNKMNILPIIEQEDYQEQ
jgi:prophage antirepressor-like protein